MKKILSLICCAALVFSMAGCTNGIKKDNGKLKIIATLYPQYDFAKQIVGDKADVELLLPAGVDSHSFDPTASDIINIGKSDMFIYTGKYMEVWADKVIKSTKSKKLKVVDTSKGITLDKPEENEEEGHEEPEEHHHEYDPHIWTDPQYAKIMVDNIVKGLCEIDEKNADFYKANAEKYKKELDRIDSELKDVVSTSKHTELFFAGRFALHYFAERYNLKYTAAYDSCSSETEPSAKAVSEIIKQMKEKKIKVIFYEELIDPKVAKAIAKETGAEPLVLHSCHNVSKDELKSGKTYIQLMEQNIINLRKGLN